MGKIDKTKPSHWENNDTFILRINDVSEYEGRYFILIKYVNDYIRDSEKKHLFRVKITKDKKEPKTLEDIKDAEYLKCFFISYEDRFKPGQGGESYEEMLERCKHLIDLKPDEFNYLYYYLIYLDFRKNIEVSNLKYIGNFINESPREYEHIPSTIHYGMPKIKPDKLVEELIKRYEDIDLKKSYDFTLEGNQSIRISAKEFWKFKLRLMEDMQKFKRGEIQLEPFYNFGWGYKLYDSDVSLDVKGIYEDAYKEGIDNKELLRKIFQSARDYMEDESACTRFWMVLADLQMKNERLDKELKRLALLSIKADLEIWEESEDYEERKKELNKLKKRLEEYQI